MSAKFLAITGSSGCSCVLAVILVADQPLSTVGKVPKLEMSHEHVETAKPEWFGSFCLLTKRPRISSSRKRVCVFFFHLGLYKLLKNMWGKRDNLFAVILGNVISFFQCVGLLF